MQSITSTLNQLNIATCGAYCADLGYRLFAMSKETSECACDNSIGINEVDLTSCSRTCGSANEPCGGSGLESVYTTGRY